MTRNNILKSVVGGIAAIGAIVTAAPAIVSSINLVKHEAALIELLHVDEEVHQLHREIYEIRQDK